MKKSLVMLTVVSVAVFLSAGSVCAFDVPFYDQSFEIGGYWYGNYHRTAGLGAHDGAYVCAHNNGIANWDCWGPSGDGINNYTLEANTVYTVSAWYKKLAGHTNAGGFLEVRIGEAPTPFTTYAYTNQTAVDPITVDDVWAEVTVTVDTIAHPECVGEYFSCLLMQTWAGDATNQMLWDDVTITGNVVPEPCSVVAFGSGLIGLVGFAIRRRK